MYNVEPIMVRIKNKINDITNFISIEAINFYFDVDLLMESKQNNSNYLIPKLLLSNQNLVYTLVPTKLYYSDFIATISFETIDNNFFAIKKIYDLKNKIK